MDLFTHFNTDGRVRMVDVGGKESTARTAVAKGEILMSPHTLAMVKDKGLAISFTIDEENSRIEIEAVVKTSGQTGVEMEALTAVSVAALTIYDMCKAVEKDMIINNVRLIKKSGGKSGDFKREA